MSPKYQKIMREEIKKLLADAICLGILLSEKRQNYKSDLVSLSEASRYLTREGIKNPKKILKQWGDLGIITISRGTAKNSKALVSYSEIRKNLMELKLHKLII